MQIQSLNIFSINSNQHISFGALKNNTRQVRQLDNDYFEKSNFITPYLSKQTFEKAKDVVLKSLTGNEPKESIVLINRDKILFQAIGNEFEVEIPEEIMDNILDSVSGNLIIVHSHTPEKTGLTAPLSLSDIKNLIDNDNIKCVCAVNNKGEYSIIEKIPGKKYDETVSEAMDNKFCAGFVKLFSGKKKKEYEEFLQTINNMSERDEANIDSSYILEMFLMQDKLDEYYDYAAGLKKFPKYADDFLKNHAKDFDFRYYSNFSF